MSVQAPFAHSRMRRARIAVSLAFLAFGTQTGLWFAHIPEVVRRLQLDPAGLSLGILIMSAIGIVSQPLAGLGIARLGSRPMAIVLLAAYAIMATLLIAAPSRPLFYLFAALTGLVAMPANVANNTLASEFERLHGRPVMSSFHGFFSVGGLSGALLGGALVAAERADPGDIGLALVCIAIVATSLWSTANALPVAPTSPSSWSKPGQAARLLPPNRAMLGLCLLVFCTALIEGSVGDWSALYLETVKNAGPALAAAGYGLFSVAMAAMRFAGGAIIERLGPGTVLVGGGGLMALGFSIVVLAPWPMVSALGFLIVAIGASNIVPILTSAAANTPGVPAGVGIATLTTFMTFGLFAGPIAIGWSPRPGASVSLSHRWPPSAVWS
jgi:MFS family permease